LRFDFQKKMLNFLQVNSKKGESSDGSS